VKEEGEDKIEKVERRGEDEGDGQEQQSRGNK
jgi:hypothetical protein